MENKNRRWQIAKNAALGVAALAWAGSGAKAASGGEASAQFLTLNGGARAAALGGAYSALGEDVGSLFYNPAGLALAQGLQAQVLYQRWIGDMNASTLGLSRTVAGLGTLAGGFAFLGAPPTEGFDESDRSQGNFSMSDMALSLGAARRLGPALAAGMNLRFVQEKLASESASAGSADLGFLYASPSGLRAGFSASNLGSGLKHLSVSSRQASLLRLGLAQTLLSRRLSLALDGVKPLDDDMEIHLGAEFAVTARAHLRLGYSLEAGGNGIPGFAGLSAGLGFQAGPLVLDYALCPMGDLGLSHFVGLGYRSGLGANPAPKRAVPGPQAGTSSAVAGANAEGKARVVDLLKKHDSQGALKLLSSLAKSRPRDPVLLFYTGAALKQQGKKAMAIKYFTASRDQASPTSKLRSQAEAQIRALSAP